MIIFDITETVEHLIITNILINPVKGYLNDGKDGEMGAVHSGVVPEDAGNVTAISLPIA